jgi:hypothetical protein
MFRFILFISCKISGLQAGNMNMAVFWVVVPCSLAEVY